MASPGGRSGYGSPGFVTSTPQYGGMGQAVVRAEVTRSSKHDGLCLYFARILEYVFEILYNLVRLYIPWLDGEMFCMMTLGNLKSDILCGPKMQYLTSKLYNEHCVSSVY